MAVAGRGSAEAEGEAFAAAHRQLLADPTLQFEFDNTVRPPPEPPDWLEPLLRFLQSIAPALQWVFWAGVVIVVGIVLWAIVLEVMKRLPSARRARKAEPPAAEPPTFRPTQARARALLEEADRLAREGRYGEAVRVLLHRSIEDIEASFPVAIGPAMTSREIARLDPLSAHGRDVFSQIARAVELSLFGGRALDAGNYAECRKAYEGFALGGRR